AFRSGIAAPHGTTPHASFTSAPVNTPTTPGIAFAAAVSMRRIFACACGLRRIAAWSMPGRRMSSTYVPAPVMSRGSSMRLSARPTYGVLVASATGHLPLASFARRQRDGVEDVRVPGAAAQVAAQPLGHFVARRLRVLREQVNRRHDHAGRAVA